MKTVFLALGSNIGDRTFFILRAIEELKNHINILKVSTVYESNPWGVENQPPFLNCVIKAETTILPEELLNIVKQIEKKVGRVDRFRWGPREIDIDILLYGNSIIDLPHLKVPHPFLVERDFFLYPLIEINHNLKHPVTDKSLSEYTSTTPNTLKPFCCIIFRP